MRAFGVKKGLGLLSQKTENSRGRYSSSEADKRGVWGPFLVRASSMAQGVSMNRRSRLSKGQFLVLFTLVLPALLGAIGLAADLGILYFNWTILQKAADAAALAGATYLAPNPVPTPAPPNAAAGCPSFPGSYDTVAAPKSVGCTYAIYNLAKVSEVTVNVPAPNPPGGVSPTVQVVLKRPNVPTYFLRLVGLKQLGVNATATALGPAAPNTYGTGLFPVGLQCTAPCDLSKLDPGQITTFGKIRRRAGPGELGLGKCRTGDRRKRAGQCD